jgi:hypothetical protein
MKKYHKEELPKTHIISWAIEALWNNGEYENIVDVDEDTAGAVDFFLTDYERERKEGIV